jgi:hypothetical protein
MLIVPPIDFASRFIKRWERVLNQIKSTHLDAKLMGGRGFESNFGIIKEKIFLKFGNIKALQYTCL